jgi:uncharacterized protein (TIGR00299 family) protein
MRIAYFEPIGGASGNMILGALCDAGAHLEDVVAALRTIPVEGWTLERKPVQKFGIAASHVEITVPGEDGAPFGNGHARGAHPNEAEAHGGRRLADVLAILRASGLSRRQKDRAAAIFARLAAAEARVHGSTPERIHFHEVGQIDAILDVAAACVALDLLGIERVACAAFPVGRGAIRMVHGLYPNPPPATAELLRWVPTYSAGIDGEMVTTTGAAILTTLADRVGERPAMIAEQIGYGAGAHDFPIPNVLRVSLGSAVAGSWIPETAEVAVLEANVDDMSPQYFELALERVFAAGALDAWLTPITMKKSRPGIVFAAICKPEDEAACARAMLAETTTLGVRVRREHRYTLARTIEERVTTFGPVRVKVARIDGTTRRTLEYEDVLRIARERSRPIAEIAALLETEIAQ